VDFVQDNVLLILVAFASGAMLLWPLVRRTSGGPWVSATQATQLINREDALVVDVREPGEYAAGHILGAKNIPLERATAGAGEIAKKKSRPLIVYCETGDRSAKALAALKAQGFTRAFNLSGGINGWRQAGLPVEK
jgi:rhodanese-related sulfurtransferase